MISLTISSRHWKNLRGVKPAVLRAAEAAAPREKRTVTILLTSNKTMKALNNQWRGKNYATNVLSFPSAGIAAKTSLGDIAIGYAVVMKEARAQGKPPLHHLQHLVVHGILHLLGHDHEADDQAEQMERKERRILRSLGVPDPYQE